MNNSIKSNLNSVKNKLYTLPFDYSEIRLVDQKSNYISISGKQTESAASGGSSGGIIRVLKNGNWLVTSFNDFSKIDYYLSKLTEKAKSIKQKGNSFIQKSSPSIINKTTSSAITLDSVSFDDKFLLAEKYNNILFNHDKIQTSRSIYKDSLSTYCFINSEGSEIIYDKSFCGVSFSATAKDGKEIQPYHNSFACYGGFEIAKGHEETAESIVKTAIEMLSAENADGGKYDIICDQKLSGVFIHEAFGHLSEADAIYEDERMKNIMTIGSEFGKETLNVIDDGTLEEYAGYIPCDDEGILSAKNYLIKDGLLSGRLHSRETAHRMNEIPTGNARAISTYYAPIVRMTNTYIDNGKFSKEDLFNSLEDGIYAVDYHGGMTNLELFTFSPAYGYLIKNGKPVKMLKNIMLSGNVFETLKKIEMIANDKMHFGGLGGCGKAGQSPLPVSLGGPHILVKDVLIGGKQ
ncbi:MAG: TldD/PmbA family protein [Spirochaetes bacterium]|nr:TldD/PmbA family protein [Spirochaetota bacterium]